MYLGIIIFMVLFIYALIKECGGIKGFIDEVKHEGLEDTVIYTVFALGMCMLIGITISLGVGLCIENTDQIYSSYVIDTTNIQSYTEGSFTIGLGNSRGNVVYLYNTQTDKGKKLEVGRTSSTYIKTTNSKATVETYKYKFKNPLYKLVALNVKENYKVINIPGDYELVDSFAIEVASKK